MIRNKKVLKTFAVFFVLNILNTALFPTVSWAITVSGTQPEFSSYESMGTTDMVNLMTGDFTYNMPLLNIPGPEGGFSLPLSYHAGIGPEQEASWVGLGWNLNPGAISRSLNQYPDDAYGEYNNSRDIMNVTLSGAGGSGWSQRYILYERNWDSKKGHGGSIDLLGVIGASWQGGNMKSGTVIGITFEDHKATTNIWDVTNGIVSAVLLVDGIATSIAKAAEMSAASIGRDLLVQAVLTGASVGFSAATFRPSYTKTYAGWTIEHNNTKFSHSSYNYYLAQTRVDEMFGPLYFGQMINSSLPRTGPASDITDMTAPRTYTTSLSSPSPVTNFNVNNGGSTSFGTTSDMHMDCPSGSNYATSVNPVSISYDHFSVMGPNVSGLIQPYRMDVGSLAMPLQNGSNDKKYNIVPFLNNYKVAFKYSGDFSNNYNYNKGDALDECGFNHAVTVNGSGYNAYLNYNIFDNTLNNIDPTKRTESDRYGLVNKRLIGSKHIEWFSNLEINSGTPTSQGKFIDFLSASQRTAFRTGGFMPPNGIGGYSITSPDGTTYHYALPVYNKVQFNTTYSGGNTATMKVPSAYANTWLLTGITGADFVDRGEVGILDDQDWGYWVKLDYGKFASNYHYRMPYWNSGEADNTGTYTTTEGLKETYYLNSVKTRSHTALFIKELRTDGRAAYSKDPVNTLNSNLQYFSTATAYDDKFPSSSLRLNQIILLKNEDLNTLVNSYSFNTNYGSSTTGLANGDTYSNIYDLGDLNTSMQTFIGTKQIRKIGFTFDYSLCNQTINSFPDPINPPHDYPYVPTTRGGKLTLKSVSVYGTNNSKMFPDFTFDYGSNNPNYGPYNYDGWGMYKNDGTNNTQGHNCSSLNINDGAAWSLQTITTPLGGTIAVEYERDSYSSISGNKTPPSLIWNVAQNTFTENSCVLKVGDQFTVAAGSIKHDPCNCPSPCDPPDETYPTYNQIVTVQSISGSTVTFTPNLNTVFGLYNTDLCNNNIMSSYTITPVATNADFKYGGDIRVSKVKVSDGINTYSTRYIYTQDGSATGVTSGVVSKEPVYISTIDYPFYHYYDCPLTPVLYSKVSVLEGNLSNDNDYVAKTEYNFQTPTSDMVSLYNVLAHYEGKLVGVIYNGAFYHSDNVTLKKYSMDVDIRTSKIGQLLSIIKTTPNGLLINRSDLGYTESTNQGVYTEGSILSEWEFDGNQDYYHRLFKTNKKYISSYLSSVKTTDGKNVNSVKNSVYDFLTGQLVEKKFSNSLGVQYTEQTLPAYQVYSKMGSKVIDPTNKNMLIQTVATYLSKDAGMQTVNWPCIITATGNTNEYQIALSGGNAFPSNYGIDFGPWIVVNSGGGMYQSRYVSPDRMSAKVISGTNITSYSSVQLYPSAIISADIQTWDNIWSYRSYNSTLNAYSNSVINDDVNTSQDERIYRKKAGYAWKSPLLNSDGTYQNFIPFDWSGANINSNWQKAGEISLYDQFSKPVESKDINGNYVSSRLGYDMKYPITSISNSKFTEHAYSGAEDLNSGTIYGTSSHHFGGEVDQASGVINNTIAHTGTSSLSLSQNQNGFIFTAKVESSGIEMSKKYRASVWVYDNGNTTANLYYKMQTPTGVDIAGSGASLSLASAIGVVKAGNWKLLNYDITIPSGNANNLLVIGCNNTSATLPAYFDDFRFHPLNASLTTSVYDIRGLVTHILDKDNFYIRNAYDNQGRLIGIYKETIQGEIKLEQYDYNFGRGSF